MKRTFINIASGGLGFALPMGINLFFTPLIVKNLGSEAFGLQSLVNVIIGFLMVADMGLDIPITQLVAEFRGKKEFKRLNELLNTSLFIYLIIGFIGALLILISASFLIDNVFKVSQNLRVQAVNVFYLAGIGFVGGLLCMWGKSVFNGLLRYDISNGINVASNLLSSILGIFLVSKGYGVVIFVLSKIMFMFLTGVTYLIIGKRFLPEFKFILKINTEAWELLKNQIGYGFILRMSGILTSRLDQTLIGIWIGLTAVGYYSIPILITTSLTGLIGSMTNFIFPSISELNGAGKKDQLELLFLRGSRLIGFFGFLVLVPFVLFGGKFLQLWVGSVLYSHAHVVFILLLIAAFFQLIIVSVLNSYVVGIGKIKYFTIYSLIRGSITACACIVLVKSMGLEGAGWAMIVALGVDLAYYYYIVNRYLKSKLPLLLLSYYLKLAIASTGAAFLVKLFYFEIVNTWVTLMVGGALYAILFFMFSIITRAWNNEEQDIATNLIKRYI